MTLVRGSYWIELTEVLYSLSMISFCRANTLNVVIIRRRYNKGAYSVNVVQWDWEYCAVWAGQSAGWDLCTPALCCHSLHTGAGFCSGVAGFAQAEVLGFICAAGALNRAQLSMKKILVTTSIYLMETLQSVRQTSSSNTADVPERLSGGER